MLFWERDIPLILTALYPCQSKTGNGADVAQNRKLEELFDSLDVDESGTVYFNTFSTLFNCLAALRHSKSKTFHNNSLQVTLTKKRLSS